MPSLRDYRRRFARHVGAGLVAGTATGGTVTYLADTTRRSSLASGDDLVEWYLYRPTAAPPDQVRLVAQVDLDQGWFYGDFPPGDRWAAAPSAGEPYELLSPEFHPTEQLHDFINESLKFCLVPAEVMVPRLPLPGRQPVTDFAPWLTSGQGIYRVGALSGTASREVSDPYLHELRGGIEEAAGSVSLRLDTGGVPASGASIGTLTASGLGLGVPKLLDSWVIPGTNWPTTYPFYLTIDTELLQVTSHDATAPSGYPILRGVSVTNDANHSGGTALMAPAQYVVQGLFPAWGFCRPMEGVYGSQQGLVLDTDEAIPEEQFVVAGALKEAWLTSPQTLEQLSEKLRLQNLQQATLAFQRWLEITRSRMGVNRTFFPVSNSVFNVGGVVR